MIGRPDEPRLTPCPESSFRSSYPGSPCSINAPPSAKPPRSTTAIAVFEAKSSAPASCPAARACRRALGSSLSLGAATRLLMHAAFSTRAPLVLLALDSNTSPKRPLLLGPAPLTLTRPAHATARHPRPSRRTRERHARVSGWNRSEGVELSWQGYGRGGSLVWALRAPQKSTRVVGGMAPPTVTWLVQQELGPLLARLGLTDRAY